MPNKEDFYAPSKDVLARHLDIYLEGMNPDNVMVVRKTLSKEEAIQKVERYLADDFLKERRLSKKTKEAVKAKKDVAKIEGVYFPCLGYLYHVSRVEFGYSYHYNGKPISISPRVYDCNMDINAFFLPYDIDYHISSLNHQKMPNKDYEDVPNEDIVKDLESDFRIRTVGNIEHDYASKKASSDFVNKLKETLKEEKQKENGVSRPIFHIALADYDCSCTKMALLLPFYLFHYDTGKEIVTIAVNAYTGEVSSPLLANPVASISYAMEEGLVYPSFSIGIFIIASLVMIILGGVIYALKHMLDIAKYNAKAKKLPYNEQQLLI